MTEHSTLPPSSAFRRRLCPASRAMEARMPEIETDEAKEGTLAHAVAAACLTGNKIPKADTNMLVHVQFYLDYIASHQEAYWPNSPIFTEQKIPIPDIDPNCFGTPDAYFIIDKVLYLFDFKYGFTPIEAFENWQLIAYASGIIDYHTAELNYVNFHIVQPRDFKNPIKTWTIGIDKFREYELSLISTERLSLRTDHTHVLAFKPTSDACKHCKARAVCNPLKTEISERMEKIQNMTTSELTPTTVGIELKDLNEASTLLDARITGLEEQAMYYLRSGKDVPHFRIGYTSPYAKWKGTPEEMNTLDEMFEGKLKKPQEYVTPNQAIKLGVPEKLVKTYSEKPHGSAKLEQIKESEIRRKFSDERNS